MMNLEWVSEYIDISDQDLSELAVKITKAGINIEKVISNNIKNLVVGEVVECVDHPDSDHLHVCKVNIGNKVTQIVCGAENVCSGIKVIVALPGAVLPGNFVIKQSKIRGVESNGMICALFELGLEEKTEENYAKGIEQLDTNAPVGSDAIKYLGASSTLYELDIHKHRNNDCYYHIGFAYEIAAILNRKVKLPIDEYNEDKTDSVKNHMSIKVETKKCPYYLAKMVKNVVIKDSPDFIKKRLISVGMRPINNVVDISNYVMLEYGQPLHFFDKDRLGDNIVVRDAKEGEKITTLDNQDRTLSSSDIVITDGKNPICIAGVMGGLSTEVLENTKNILIESAIFDAVSIRNTANKLDLRSEASIRYGKGLNYEYTKKAMDRACHLLEKYADATIISDIICYDEIDKDEKIVEFYKEDVNKLLGIEISEDDMKVELERLDFEYKLIDSKFIVKIPNRRLDIDSNVNDIAEEIGRLYGYHNLVSTLPRVPIKKGVYVGEVKVRKQVSKRLRTLGLNEVKTYTLTSPEMNTFNYDNKEQIILPNPMSSDKSLVRTSIIPSLINVYNYNKSRKIDDILIYEISKTYDKNYNEESKIAGLLSGNYIANSLENGIKVDFYVVKGIVENLLKYMGFKNRYSFVESTCNDLHPGISADIYLDRELIGIIGRVHPSIEKKDVYVFELSLNKLMVNTKPLKFKEAPKYPGIEKDMAFILGKDIRAGDVIKTIKKAGGRLLNDINVFDIYTGENIGLNNKSLAFKLHFIDEDRTLTDDEVMDIFNNIINKVEEVHNAKLRDK